jgi:hypothetical protein
MTTISDHVYGRAPPRKPSGMPVKSGFEQVQLVRVIAEGAKLTITPFPGSQGREGDKKREV